MCSSSYEPRARDFGANIEELQTLYWSFNRYKTRERMTITSETFATEQARCHQYAPLVKGASNLHKQRPACDNVTDSARNKQKY
ncbi:hypothetical protein VYA_33190 [Vibrio alfacsensis]|nr:hypothetical protein VYA_33190 [Vibrio alfacsensis]